MCQHKTYVVCTNRNMVYWQGNEIVFELISRKSMRSCLMLNVILVHRVSNNLDICCFRLISTRVICFVFVYLIENLF